MSAPTSGDVTALGDEVQRHQLSGFEVIQLVVFAALPEWTSRRAQAAGIPLPELAPRLATARLAERREEISPEGDVFDVWWMPSSKRADVGRYLRESLHVLTINSTVVTVARDLSGLVDDPFVLLWCRAVENSLSADSDVLFIPVVDELLGMGQSAAAVDFVAAALALGDVCGEPLLSAARRAEWRIDRGYREGLDTRALAHYLPRPQIEEALVELVRDESQWALHLVGAGGVGKTMTVRDLASGQFFDRHGLPRAPVARIDFDHLDPRYPHRRPGELLLALTTELVGHTTNRSGYRSYRQVDDDVAALHELLAEDGSPDQALDRAIDSFAAFLDEFDQTVVLVLDTCEELAKLYGPGGRAPAVDYTFDILERVHARAPRMKALLAGRRWLVPTDASRSAGLRLEPRPYLNVVTVNGFTTPQGETYLDTRDPDHVVPDALRELVLERSQRPGADDINPFDLACYTDWALDEPDLNEARLRDDAGDPYIRQRIIERVTSTVVRDCLPAAVELGRFDLPMIEPYLVRRGIDPQAAFSGLVGQEWVSAVTFDADGRPSVIEIDDQLLPRLRAVVAASPTRFPVDRHQLGRDLAELIGSLPVESLAPEAVEGALRLLPLDEAAAMWSVLEGRILMEDAWGWALVATPRAAAVESARWPLPTGHKYVVRGSEPTLLAAILATQASAVLRQPGQPGLWELWKSVAVEAPRHPDPATAAWLELRGRCGRIATGTHLNEDDLQRIAELRDARDLPSWAGMLIAAVDGCGSRGERVPGWVWSVASDELDRLPQGSPSFAAVALARAADSLIAADADEAATHVEAALAELRTTRLLDEVWLDWVPSARLLDRARLARVALALVRFEPWNPEFAQWREEAIPHLADIDAERLVAATIEHQFGWRLVSGDELAYLLRRETYEPLRQPVHHWHGLTGTLCRVANIALAAAGNPGVAISNLQLRKERATAFGEDPATIDQCDLGLTTLYEKLRATELTRLMRRLTAADNAAVSQAASLALQRYSDDPGDFDPRLVPDRAPVELEEQIRLVLPVRSAPLETFDLLLGGMLRAESMLGRRRADVDVFLEKLPTRRVAEIALAEGELVAQRWPSRAIVVLERAVALFRRCDDEHAEYRASLFLAITADRAGINRGTSLPPRPTTDLYGGWRVLAEWPLGRPVVHTGEGRDAAAPESPAPQSLRPWFLLAAAGVAVAMVIWLPWWLALSVIVLLGVVLGLTSLRRDVEPHSGGAVRPKEDQPVLDRSVAYGLGERRWSRCTIELDGKIGVWLVDPAVDLNVGEDANAALADLPPDEFASRRPYVVVPLLLPGNEIGLPWELRLGTRNPRLGAKVPLWVRFRNMHRVISVETTWSDEAEVKGEQAALGERYFGPSNLRPDTTAGPADRVHYHLVGTPVLTKAGWQFRVGESGSGEQSGRTTYGYEQLIAPEALPQKGVQLVVLQAEPVDGPPEPLGRLREGMVGFAEGMFVGPAVLIVPPLPDALAAEVAFMVEHLARGRTPTTDMLLDLVHQIRGRIAVQDASLDVLLIL